MPIYEYECENCGNTLEKLNDTQDIEVECACGSIAKRVLSVFATIGKRNAPCGVAGDRCGIGGDMGNHSACGKCCGQRNNH